jgi:integrase
MGVRVRQRNDKPGWWVYIHHNGQRKKKYFGSNKALAQEFARKLEAKLTLGSVGIATKAGVKVEDYADTWLGRIKHSRKHTTYDDYRKILDRDILPCLRGLDLEDVTREKVKALAVAGFEKGQSPKTVQNTIRCLSSLLSHAVEDGLVTVNHALKPGKFLPKISKRRSLNPLTREEVATFLETVKQRAPRYYPLFLCAARTGSRMGELLALQWGDLDFHGRFIQVQRNYTHWKVTTPKSGESRRVDMSKELAQTLKDLQTERQLEAAANGWAEVPPWVFCNERGGLLHPHNLRDRVFYRLLKAAGLRQVRFHDLRHTFASLLFQQGESPVYVKEQMGHSSIQVTVDLYGHLIPGGNKQAVDRLDTPVDKSRPEAESAPQTHPHVRKETVGSSGPTEDQGDGGSDFGVSDGFRTRNLWSHSPAL